MEGLHADSDQDWLLDSLDKYEGIYMFEFQYPTACLEWHPQGSAIWVVCTSTNTSEILQLALPERLLDTEEQTLWAKRDFKLINGVITKSHITCLKYLTAAQCVVSANSEAELSLWTTDKQNPDLLQEVDKIQLNYTTGLTSSILLDTCPTHPSLLLTGSSSRLCSLQVLDLTSKKQIFQFTLDSVRGDNCLHATSFLQPDGDGSLLLTCSGHGHLDIWDFRKSASLPVSTTSGTDPTSQQCTSSPASHCYAMAVSCEPHPGSKLALLTNTGTLKLHDTRRLQLPVTSCSFGKESTTNPFTGRSRPGGNNPLCIKYSPVNSNILSLSGINNGVQVYDTSTWSQDMSVAPSPLFVHLGHEAENPEAHVLVHSWQPRVQGATILSADSLASLHAWQWKRIS